MMRIKPALSHVKYTNTAPQNNESKHSKVTFQKATKKLKNHQSISQLTVNLQESEKKIMNEHQKQIVKKVNSPIY